MVLGARVLLLIVLLAVPPATSQQALPAVNNSDVLNMWRAGIGEQTILLAIRRGSPRFDTSPAALIELKQSGVPDAVLNAILTATVNSKPAGTDTGSPAHPVQEPAPVASGETHVECVGGVPFVALFSSSDPASMTSVEHLGCGEPVTVLSRNSGQFFKVRAKGDTEGFVNSFFLQGGAGQVGTGAAQRPGVAASEAAPTGAAEAQTQEEASGVVKEIPPDTVLKTPSRIPLTTTRSAPRSDSGGYTLSIRVLQEEQVPYVVQTGGGQVSTSCAINGTTNTNGVAVTSGNTLFGNATSYSNLTMNCNSYQVPPTGWRHVLNAMLVVASNGNAYIIACDAAWRWSKCRGLIAGDVFAAKMTSKGLAVQYSLDGKSKEATYAILQAKVLGQ